MASGVARKPIDDLTYKRDLSARLDPTASFCRTCLSGSPLKINALSLPKVKKKYHPGGAGLQQFRLWSSGPAGPGSPHQTADRGYGPDGAMLEIINAKISDHNQDYIRFLYKKLQRHGVLERDCQRMVNLDRNVFAACMVANGHTDALVTGMTVEPNWLWLCHPCYRPKKGREFVTTSMLISRGRTVFMGDTSIHERPSGEQMADIAEVIAEKARSMGHTPRVAILSFSNFGNPDSAITQTARDAVAVLDQRKVDFEYEGEMTADIALDYELMQARYPFSRLKGPANILVMPGLHSANICFVYVHSWRHW